MAERLLVKKKEKMGRTNREEENERSGFEDENKLVLCSYEG